MTGDRVRRRPDHGPGWEQPDRGLIQVPPDATRKTVEPDNTDLRTDRTWVLDSTPVECGRSRSTAKRPDPAGWAGYGYRALHSRFWGLRLHLACTPAGLPVA